MAIKDEDLVSMVVCDFCGYNEVTDGKHGAYLASCVLCHRRGCSRKHFRYFAEITEGSCSKVRIALCADCIEKRRKSAIVEFVKKLIEEAGKINEAVAEKEETEGEEK